MKSLNSTYVGWFSWLMLLLSAGTELFAQTQSPAPIIRNFPSLGAPGGNRGPFAPRGLPSSGAAGSSQGLSPGDLATSGLTRRSLSAGADPFARGNRTNSLQSAMPQMFADSPSAPLRVVVNDGLIATTDVPLGGAARRLKFASNNRALPQDRIIFQYQLYVDALTADASQFIVGPDRRTIDLHQYTVGFEKTFLDGVASIDVRMPFTNRLELATPNFGAEGGNIGNLNAKLKTALLFDETYCFSTGLGFEAPTGSSVSFQGNGLAYIIHNDAFFLQPFMAYEERVNDWFVQAFAGVDVALNGNRFRDDFVGAPVLGRVNDQTLGIASLGGGKWLFYDPDRRRLNGIAAMAEFHYTTALQDADAVTDAFIFQTATVANTSNRSDHLNFTAGTNLALGDSSLRFGFVQPLRTGDDRLFDHEFNFQFNRAF